VKLGPTAANDQDNNEKSTGYLEYQPRSKEEQVNSFVKIVLRRIKKGCSVCHVVFIFQHSTPIGSMKSTLNNVYRAISTRYDRDPRKSDNAEKPWFFLWPDIPGALLLSPASSAPDDFAQRLCDPSSILVPEAGKDRRR
jgi:hypothetical protein